MGTHSPLMSFIIINTEKRDDEEEGGGKEMMKREKEKKRRRICVKTNALRMRDVWRRDEASHFPSHIWDIIVNIIHAKHIAINRTHSISLEFCMRFFSFDFSSHWRFYGCGDSRRKSAKVMDNLWLTQPNWDAMRFKWNAPYEMFMFRLLLWMWRIS